MEAAMAVCQVMADAMSTADAADMKSGGYAFAPPSPLRNQRGDIPEAKQRCDEQRATESTLDSYCSDTESGPPSSDKSWGTLDADPYIGETASDAGSEKTWGTVDALPDDWESDNEASFDENPDTLIFVDADGVINVGINDGHGQAPLLLCQDNLARCKPCTSPPRAGSVKAISHIMYETACRQVGHGDEGTFSKFATPGADHMCSLFVQRLAEIRQHAGPRAKMVLSSSWRQSQHLKRVEALEAALSKCSGEKITFDAQTQPGSDHPSVRLQLIGDFVHEYSVNHQHSGRPLRVLVLDDFAASQPPMENFATTVEAHLRERSCQPERTSVKLVHCYEKWTTSLGLSVQAGTGLTRARMCEAEHFLLSKPACSFCANPKACMLAAPPGL